MTAIGTVTENLNSDDAQLERQNQVRIWLQKFPVEAPVVAIPVYNAFDETRECLDSLLATTAADIPILMLDDASPDSRIPATFGNLAQRNRFFYIRKPTNSGFVGTCNLAFAWTAPRDLILINSDVIVPPQWLERLQAAAYYRTNIATATPFTNYGTIVSLPYRNRPVQELVEGLSMAEMDERVRVGSRRLYPIIPTAVGHCVYFKRAALEVVGYFDEAFAPGYGEEVDFSQRAILAGFSHVLADDLFVYHKGSRSFTESKRQLQAAHDQMIFETYPWYHRWAAQTGTRADGPLDWAIEQAQTALLGYRIAVDATCIGGTITGTQMVTLELIRALALLPHRQAQLSIIIQDKLDRKHLLGVDKLVDQVWSLAELQNTPEPVFNLVHRPFQINSLPELIFLDKISQRLIVSQLDFIRFSNPTYSARPEAWNHYRRLTRLVCQTAAGVTFISADGAADASHQGIQIAPERMRVISPGVDHALESLPDMSPESHRQPLAPPFILLLGTNFRHKNRVFALKLLRVLLDDYDWDGRVVFAGPNAAFGTSEVEEKQFLQQNPDLQPRVHSLGAVTLAQKQQLLRDASLLLYPSTYEGFGLVPFEAAAEGTPALTTRATSLQEIMGDEVVYLETYDPIREAKRVWSLLSDPDAAARQVAAIQARRPLFNWDRTARQTWDFYQHILDLPIQVEQNRFELMDQSSRDVVAGQLEHLPGWRRRLALASFLIFAEGGQAVFKEIRQFLKWLIR